MKYYKATVRHDLKPYDDYGPLEVREYSLRVTEESDATESAIKVYTEEMKRTHPRRVIDEQVIKNNIKVELIEITETEFGKLNSQE
ncbi:hypothetical protein KY328_02845 [Candidatus Woesearchaeota archaeon]|nr:hypothetical protein [Candidatus Woesearchaeota archaeon]MBW3021831.1 hypothetical protein [Candidatus Woesearchaeota archaeon]